MARWRTRLGLLTACVAVGALAACGGDNQSSGTSAAPADVAAFKDLGSPYRVGTPQRGGTLRAGVTEILLTDGLDPTGEYAEFQLHRIMLRPLLGYRGTAGPVGNELIPDLAESLPEVSADGLTYTFRLRDGVRFAPPVNRPITSQDVKYAIERIGKPGFAQYPKYYTPIKGFQEFMDGKATTIPGISTPDERTIVFTLTKPKGDFPYALSLPASAPIPAEVARCHDRPGEYGRYQVASGPYMIEGSDRLDISSCAAQKPLSGFDPLSKLTLVRNPSYDPATTEPGTRPDYVDRIEITVDANASDTLAKVARGELDISLDRPPPADLRGLLADPATRPHVRVDSADTIWALIFNLTQPPFDDVHVRRAMNLAMDLEGIQRAWGGPIAGNIATDIVADTNLSNRLPTAHYQPLQKAPFEGDLEAAKAEMRKSRYDRDKDGVCDAPACRHILVINRNTPTGRGMAPIIRHSATGIGLDLTIRSLPVAVSFAAVSTPSKPFGMAANVGFFRDYPDPSGFFVALDGRVIVPRGNFINISLTGITPAKAAEAGVTLPKGERVPSIDADIDACVPLSGQERLDCWEKLDRKVMETIVPAVPLLDATRVRVIGPSVTAYDLAQAVTDTAFDRIAVDPAKQR
jgi:peptide/nickel transport system substrate-binding protein